MLMDFHCVVKYVRYMGRTLEEIVVSYFIFFKKRNLKKYINNNNRVNTTF